MTLAVGSRLGPYEITAAIGAGGMGEVYRARDTKLGRDVALKVLPRELAHDAERLARFRREAQLLASLSDAHIAAIHGLEEADGIVALALELAEGEDLAQRLKRGPIPVEETLAIARQIAEGLEAAHEKGIVHRDLKPANIKLAPDGKVKILDFGLAKAWAGDAAASSPELSHSPTLSHGTDAGVILGTAAYMSPEQARGKPVDKRADVWAFGVVVYEMLAGRRLFTGETVSDTLAAVLLQDPDWTQLPPGTPPAVRQTLRRCLERDPRERLHDIGDVRIELQDALEPVPRGPAPSAVVQRGSAWHLVLAATLAAASGAAAGFHLRPAPPLPPVVRATLPAPVGTELVPVGDAPGPVTVSPDGQKLAFTARGEGGVAGLYVHSLATGLVRLIPSSDGARYPFWSPDSRSLGFFNGQHLLRVDVAEGSPLLLAPADAARGGTWGKGGVIVYAPSFTTPLFQVPAAGGTPTPASTLDPGGREGTHRFPSFLPDGRHFVFEVRGHNSWMRAQDGIAVGSIEDPRQRVPLLPFASSASYAGGQLLFVRNGDLCAQRFDPDRLALSGSVAILVRDVRFDRRYSLGVFSAAPGVLAVQHSGGQDATELAWLDRAGRRLRVVHSATDHDDVALSPQGSQVLLSIYDRTTSRSHLEVLDLERRTTTRLTFGEADDYGAIWSPDGARVLFARVGDQGIGLWVKPADGSAAEQPFRPESRDELLYPLSFSPDGTRVLVLSLPGGSIPTALWILPASGQGKLERYTSSAGLGDVGRFSPDGRWVLFDANEGPGSRSYLARFPDTGGRWQLAEKEAWYGRWTKGGKEIVYASGDTGGITALPVDLSGAAPRFGEPTRLFNLPIMSLAGVSFDVTPDGERILAYVPVEGRRVPYTLILNWERLLEGGP